MSSEQKYDFSANMFQIVHVTVDFIAICLVMYYCSSKVGAIRSENEVLKKDIEDLKGAVVKQQQILSNIMQHIQRTPNNPKPQQSVKQHHHHAHKKPKKVTIKSPPKEEINESDLDDEINDEVLNSLSDDDDEAVVDDEEENEDDDEEVEVEVEA